MNEQDILDFENEYRSANTPALPGRLQGYRFLSCLQENDGRCVWLLADESGRLCICKHAQGAYISMLRTENNMESFSFFPYIIDYFETEDGAYLLREYILGDTLEELVEKRGPMCEAEALAIIRQVGACLIKLHHANPPIIYRDLKPSNIVLTPGGECFLIDMGAARTFRRGTDKDTEIVGSQATAAPEQFGARQTDARTDIYSLGLLYTYLLTGELKNDGKRDRLSRRTRHVIRKASSFDPDRRYASVEEFLTAAAPFAPCPALLGTGAALAVILCALVCCLLLSPRSFLTSEASPAERGQTQENTVQGEVTFDTLLMQEAVNSALGKAADAPVTYEELTQITDLCVCGDIVFTDYGRHQVSPFEHTLGANGEHIESNGNISDLSVLAHMPNLRRLILDRQNITDLTPLAGLHLTDLSLCANPLTDLTPLADCETLRRLYIADTDISDLTPLADCSIEELDISRTKVKKIAPAAGNPIGVLSLADIILDDCDALAQMPIWRLYCRRLPHEYFEPLSQITTLDGITIYDSGITSLEDVAVFQQVAVLDVSCNPITSLKGIGQFPNLVELNVNCSPVRELAGIEDAARLGCLAMTESYVEDFSPLPLAPCLREITLSKEQAGKLREQIPDPKFSVYDWCTVNY